MADKQDQRKTTANHESTWGATEAAKEAWTDRNGEQVRKSVAKDNEEKAAGA